jgi:hypothetical protein
MLQKAMKNRDKLRTINVWLSVALLAFASLLSMTPHAYAATMTKASVLESNMNASATSAVYVDFIAGASDIAGTLTAAFQSGVTPAGTQTPATATCTTLFTGATALPHTGGSLTAAGATQTVTVSSVGALTSGTQYCFDLTGAAVTNGSAGNYTVTLTDASDSTVVGIDVISNDQIAVDATVPPSFTLGFGGNVAHLGTLSSGAVAVTGTVALTVSTNAAYGWGLWAEDAYGGIHSTAAGKTILSAATGSHDTLAAGTEGYALGVTSGNATTNYTSNGTTTGSGLSSSAYNEIASASGPGSSVGVNVIELAAISGVTPAAPDYGDTVTIIGAGSF